MPLSRSQLAADSNGPVLLWADHSLFTAVKLESSDWSKSHETAIVPAVCSSTSRRIAPSPRDDGASRCCRSSFCGCLFGRGQGLTQAAENSRGVAGDIALVGALVPLSNPDTVVLVKASAHAVVIRDWNFTASLPSPADLSVLTPELARQFVNKCPYLLWCGCSYRITRIHACRDSLKLPTPPQPFPGRMGEDESGGAQLVDNRRADILAQALDEVPHAQTASIIKIALRRRHRDMLDKLLHQLLTTCPPSTRKEVLMYPVDLTSSSINVSCLGEGQHTKPLIVHLLKKFPDVLAELLQQDEIKELENMGSLDSATNTKKTYLMKLHESNNNLAEVDTIDRFSTHWCVSRYVHVDNHL